MSLINDALRKAQRQRDEAAQAGAPQPPRPGPVPRVAKRGAPLPARTVVLIASTSGGVLALGIAAFLWFTREPSPPPAPAPVVATKAPSAPVSTPAASAGTPVNSPTPVAAAPSPVPTTTTVPAPTSAPTAPPAAAVAATSPAPAPVAVAPTPAPTSAPTPVAAELAPAVQTPPAVAAAPTPTPTRYPNYSTTKASGRPDMRVYEFLDKTRITGIRQSETDPKVLMNDRVFRIGDVVDNITGLRLKAVAVGMLTFADEAGVEYTRSF